MTNRARSWATDLIRPGRGLGWWSRALACLISWWAAPLNLWKLWRSRHYLTTYRGLADPIAKLRRFCPDIAAVRTRMLGTSYLAVGHYHHCPGSRF